MEKSIYIEKLGAAVEQKRVERGEALEAGEGMFRLAAALELRSITFNSIPEERDVAGSKAEEYLNIIRDGPFEIANKIEKYLVEVKKLFRAAENDSRQWKLIVQDTLNTLKTMTSNADWRRRWRDDGDVLSEGVQRKSDELEIALKEFRNANYEKRRVGNISFEGEKLKSENDKLIKHLKKLGVMSGENMVEIDVPGGEPLFELELDDEGGRQPPTIVNIHPDAASPAIINKMRLGDQILRINGVKTWHLNKEELKQKLVEAGGREKPFKLLVLHDGVLDAEEKDLGQDPKMSTEEADMFPSLYEKLKDAMDKQDENLTKATEIINELSTKYNNPAFKGKTLTVDEMNRRNGALKVLYKTATTVVDSAKEMVDAFPVSRRPKVSTEEADMFPRLYKKLKDATDQHDMNQGDRSSDDWNNTATAVVVSANEMVKRHDLKSPDEMNRLYDAAARNMLPPRGRAALLAAHTDMLPPRGTANSNGGKRKTRTRKRKIHKKKSHKKKSHKKKSKKHRKRNNKKTHRKY